MGKSLINILKCVAYYLLNNTCKRCFKSEKVKCGTKLTVYHNIASYPFYTYPVLRINYTLYMVNAGLISQATIQNRSNSTESFSITVAVCGCFAWKCMYRTVL